MRWPDCDCDACRESEPAAGVVWGLLGGLVFWAAVIALILWIVL
jgi:hypothetical protein